MTSPAGKWDYSKGAPTYGTEASYRRAALLLDHRDWTVADWGCGGAAAKKYFTKASYKGIDGSPGFADVVADLLDYREKSDGILLRHVLEHNYDWRRILENAIASARRLVVVVFFLVPKEPEEIHAIGADGVPAIHVSRRTFAEVLAHRSFFAEAIDRNDSTPHKHEWIFGIYP